MPNQTVLQAGRGDDLFVYFHIHPDAIRERVAQVTSDTVVTELWGQGTNAYRSVMAGYGGWIRYCDAIAQKLNRPRFQRTTLTTWSAGSQIVKTVCRGLPNMWPDAIVSLDGLYGNKPPGARPGDGNVNFDAELRAVAQYALAAAKGERIFVLLHSNIPTPYGSSGECAHVIQHWVQEQLGAQMAEDSSVTAADLDNHQFLNAFVLGNFHLIEFPGRDGNEHMREGHLYDEVWQKWIPWCSPAEPNGPTPRESTTSPIKTDPNPHALNEGDSGPDVQAWQNFLIGQGNTLLADGSFGAKTASASRAWQQKVGLTPDGIVGQQTLAKARELGFGKPSVEDDSFPPRPSFPPLVGTKARRDVFGAFAYESAPQAGNPEAIRILDNWRRENIIAVQIPQLAKVKGAPANCEMEWHRKGAEQLKALWAAWEKSGLLPLVLTWAGSYAPRFIRGSQTTLSNHAFGSAFDINAGWNPMGARPARKGAVGSVIELVPLATEHGFYWGGFFDSRPDGMHFEIARLLG